MEQVIFDKDGTEYLCVERKKILEYYKDVQQAIGEENGDTKIEMEGRKMAMRYFFGDKCLPDKEPSVQVEPKFSKGITVKIVDNRVKTFGNIATITHCEVDEGKVFYWLNDDIGCYMENQLEPYTEPETKPLRVGDKVKVKGEDKVREIFRILPDGRIMFGDKGNTYSAEELELVEETKDMEEKELNLCELLSKGDLLESEFFSPAFGKVTLSEVRPDEYEVVIMDVASACEYSLDLNGCLMSSPYGFCVLFPSRALYEKYPLDAYSAWMEWKAQRELEFNKPECYITDVNKWWELKVVAKFHSLKEAQQAAEAVRETLMKFHEQNQKQ